MADFPDQPVTIKKYANRRLYNTSTSSYVTLDDLAQMVKDDIKFNVYDARTSEDLTRSVLAQIIFEEESKTGQNLLPIGFLRQLISFYGDSLQWLVPRYLEHTMEALASNQERIRACFNTAFGSMFPFGNTLEEVGKQNLAMFDRAMRMFMPFGGQDGMASGIPFAFMPPAEPVNRKDAPQTASAKPRSDATPAPAQKAQAATPATSSESAKPVRMATVSSLVTHLAGQQAQTMTQPRNFSQVSSGAMTSRAIPAVPVGISAVPPSPAVAQAAAAQEAALATGKEVQSKIAALQKQLAELKKKGKA